VLTDIFTFDFPEGQIKDTTKTRLKIGVSCNGWYNEKEAKLKSKGAKVCLK
jgi:hypothetical protein